MRAKTGQKAPLLTVSDWVQGDAVNFDQLTGKVVLVEVFQVNCPGCFLYALPQAIDLYQKYTRQGLVILGVATAFEDFDKNNLENLNRLIQKNEVIGETLTLLKQRDQLIDNRLPYSIPFPVGMDRLTKRAEAITQDQISLFIDDRITNFHSLSQSEQLNIRQQVQSYFQSLDYHAETFETYELKGTPSHILVDKEGVLIDCSFGINTELEAQIVALLKN